MMTFINANAEGYALAREFARNVNVPLKIGNIAEQGLTEAIYRG